MDFQGKWQNDRKSVPEDNGTENVLYACIYTRLFVVIVTTNPTKEAAITAAVRLSV